MKRQNTQIKYRYEALDDAGSRVKGVEVAPSLSAAHAALVGRGMQPIGVSRPRSILKFEITKKKVPRKDVMNFSRQLAVFMKAGIPIMESLEVIEDETSEKVLRNVLKDVVE